MDNSLLNQELKNKSVSLNNRSIKLLLWVTTLEINNNNNNNNKRHSPMFAETTTFYSHEFDLCFCSCYEYPTLYFRALYVFHSILEKIHDNRHEYKTIQVQLKTILFYSIVSVVDVDWCS